MESIDLPALTRAAGTVRLPGSKSISNRMLLLASLADGTTEIRDLLDSENKRGQAQIELQIEFRATSDRD